MFTRQEKDLKVNRHYEMLSITYVHVLYISLEYDFLTPFSVRVRKSRVSVKITFMTVKFLVVKVFKEADCFQRSVHRF